MNKLGWGFFLVLTFMVSLPISWVILAKADFAYAYLYDAIEISAHIDRYAPRNTQKKNHFEETTKEERVELFHGVVQSIQAHGVGLESLEYIDKVTQTPIKLFTKAEIVHLQDVAKLIDFLKVMVVGLVFVWFMILIALKRKGAKMPSAKQLFFSTILILVMFGGLLLMGPEAIFNQLHIWIFPENHQWFFYYEESLMSTMMKAPDLFGYIAGLMVAVSIILTMIIMRLFKYIL